MSVLDSSSISAESRKEWERVMKVVKGEIHLLVRPNYIIETNYITVTLST